MCLQPKLIIPGVTLNGDSPEGREEAASPLRHSPSRKRKKQIVDGASRGVQIWMCVQIRLSWLLWLRCVRAGLQWVRVLQLWMSESGSSRSDYPPRGFIRAPLPKLLHGFVDHWQRGWWVCFQLKINSHIQYKPLFKSSVTFSFMYPKQCKPFKSHD